MSIEADIQHLQNRCTKLEDFTRYHDKVAHPQGVNHQELNEVMCRVRVLEKLVSGKHCRHCGGEL
jgi:hypothetical protein